MRNKNKKNIGFSLIEILITVLVIIIFAGIGLANYNNFILDQKLKDEAKKLISVLELAKKEASSATASVACDINNKIYKGYQVIVDNNGYRLYRCCASCDDKLSDYSFLFGIKLKSDPSTILFRPLSSGITISGGNPIVLMNELNHSINILINIAGTIEETFNW
ncbi:MAG: hypothetical protein QHH09_01540 [Microgenomates group bacterium]|nr:hypothetical protein [Microgenomates group bacterium]